MESNPFPELKKLAEKQLVDNVIMGTLFRLHERIQYLEKQLLQIQAAQQPMQRLQPNPIPDDYDKDYVRASMGIGG